MKTGVHLLKADHISALGRLSGSPLGYQEPETMACGCGHGDPTTQAGRYQMSSRRVCTDGIAHLPQGLDTTAGLLAEQLSPPKGLVAGGDRGGENKRGTSQGIEHSL